MMPGSDCRSGAWVKITASTAGVTSSPRFLCSPSSVSMWYHPIKLNAAGDALNEPRTLQFRRRVSGKMRHDVLFQLCASRMGGSR